MQRKRKMRTLPKEERYTITSKQLRRTTKRMDMPNHCYYKRIGTRTEYP